jgi:hypothetical protein
VQQLFLCHAGETAILYSIYGVAYSAIYFWRQHEFISRIAGLFMLLVTFVGFAPEAQELLLAARWEVVSREMQRNQSWEEIGSSSWTQ